MKVLIANPPAYITDLNRHFIQAGSRWSFSGAMPKDKCKEHYLPYPFFIGYSSALLKRDVPEVETRAVDACALDFDEREFIVYVQEYAPDILIVEIPTISFSLMMGVLKEIKETVGCAIAIAGGHATALANEVMKENKFIDYCLLGEYETSLKELIKTLISKEERKLNNLSGMAFRHGAKIFKTKQELIEDLDYLPFPDRDDLPVENYHDFEIVGKPCVQIWSSRGCPFNCGFCLHRQVIYASPLYRKRNPIKVVDEMEICKEKYGAEQIYFDDDTMAPDRGHMKAICEEILRRKLELPWGCMGDINLNLETLELMKKAGCVGIKFGVETIDPETLRKMGKSFVSAEKAKQFVKRCRKLGIYTHATYMIGFPTDTKESVLTTLKFAMELNTESLQVSIATPFPGTPFYDLCDKNGWLLTKDWVMYNGAGCSVVSYPHLSKEEIEELYKTFNETWRKVGAMRPLRWYVKHPNLILRYMQKYGIPHSLKKSIKLLKS